ncbi:MAG: hypothetical protein JNM45_09085 [Rhizobiales bacterium]|nr:hypothetical protein [Hyphomicrobiales bacterium]
MDQRFKAPRGRSDIALDQARTHELLRNLVDWKTGPETLESVRLDTEAASSFIAEHAAMLSAVSHAAGLSTAKILCDVLYVNTFRAKSGGA